jgi:hypothetical protein
MPAGINEAGLRSDERLEAPMADLQILRYHPAHDRYDTFDQERCEVLESVMAALSSTNSDPDEMAACSHLLQHLAGLESGRAA